jgi:PTH1 family peptidyl-tRNA hydrolase
VKIVVGLGNPGRKHERTRHNLGFMVVDRIASEKGVVVKRKVCDALLGEFQSEEGPILLAKPQTYMNRSGDSVKTLLEEFRASANDLIVVHDDLDLAFGRIRIRSRGSAGGHRGVLSIMEALPDMPFYRIRLGIGRPQEGIEPVDYVLEPFSAQEVGDLDELIARASDAVLSLIHDGASWAMGQFNRAC